MSELIFKKTYAFLDKEGIKIIKDMRALLKQGNKNASYALYNSLDYDIEQDGDQISLVISYAKQGQYVLDGRKIGKRPPMSAILNWLRQKRIALKTGQKRNLQGKAYSKEEELKGLAFAIAGSIAKKGIKPFNFVKSYDNLIASKRFNTQLSKNVALDIAEAINNGQGALVASVKP